MFFQFYNGWLSLLGAILCVAVMFLMNWPTALVTFGCLFTLYLVVMYRKPGKNSNYLPIKSHHSFIIIIFFLKLIRCSPDVGLLNSLEYSVILL